MLQTKRKILELLNKKEMTITQLSKELSLSTATISQHIDDLARTGSIEKIENEHFRKMKYYRAVPESRSITFAKYVFGAIVVIAFIVIMLIYVQNTGYISLNKSNTTSSVNPANSIPNATPVKQSNSSSVMPITGGLGATACPMIDYQMSGSIYNSIGFAVYPVSTSSGSNTLDYVIKPGVSGVLHANESITALPGAEGSIRQHYVSVSQFNGSLTDNSGIKISINPENYTIANSTILLSLNVSVNASAPEANYWLRIDGPCGVGVLPVVLTIGNRPYNGVVPVPAGIYS